MSGTDSRAGVPCGIDAWRPDTEAAAGFCGELFGLARGGGEAAQVIWRPFAWTTSTCQLKARQEQLGSTGARSDEEQRTPALARALVFAQSGSILQSHERLPDAYLPDLLLEIAAKTGFIDGFTHDHEPHALLSDLQTSICAVLVAQACNVGYAPLVDEAVPALREARLKYVARHYIRPETLIAANARIVDYHAALELATRWGGGEVASIDGLRFVVPNRTIHAGFNRRYYHRRRGVTALTTTADHHATLHTIVVPGTQPDALYLLDGLLDPQTSVRPCDRDRHRRLHRRRLRALPAARLPVLPTARGRRRRPVLAA